MTTLSSVYPTKISRPAPYLLAVEWSDGVRATITLRVLRDECPCAACKGENIMGTTYSFGMTVIKPGMYELAGLHAVGNYAVQANWGDGHNTGIYSWDVLRAITAAHALTDEDIARLAEQAKSESQS
jgi:DUF971 family protein